MSLDPLADAISFYDDLLQGDVLRRTHEVLQRDAEAWSGTSGRPRYRSLRPHFVTPEQHADFQRAAHAVGQALEEQVLHRLRNKDTFGLMLPRGWEALLAVDGHREGRAVSGRLDGLVGPDGVIRFIGYEPDPVGAVRAHAMGEAFDATPVMEAFEKRYEVFRPATAPNLVPALTVFNTRAGRAGPPRLACFGPPGIWGAEGERAYQDHLEANGCPLRVVTPKDDWTYSNSVLRVGGFEVDAITATPGAGLDGLVEGCGPEHPVQRALRDGAAAFMNGLSRSILLRSRALLVDFSIWPNFFGDKAALMRHIPWTRHASRGMTRGIEGKRVELMSYAAENRERLVLKPTFGSGAVLGWRTDEATWNSTLERALVEAWIVQERVPVTEALHPVLDGDQVRHEAMTLDLAPLLWNEGRQEGFLVRQSPAATPEPARSRSVTPLVVVRGRAS